MAPNTTFRSLTFYPFLINHALNNKNKELDVNFFHDNNHDL